MSTNVGAGAHRAQRVRLQAVVVGEDEPRRGQDRHDAATPLPVDGWPAGLRGGGAVPGTGGQSRSTAAVNDLVRGDLQTLLQLTERERTRFYRPPPTPSPGGEGVLGSLPAPANPQPEVARARQERGVRGQSENGDGPVEPDGEGDVGGTQHGRPAQGDGEAKKTNAHVEE